MHGDLQGDGLGIQHLADAVLQNGKAERFLEQVNTGIEGAIETNGILGITRHVEHADVREQSRDLHCQFAAIHAGHNDIGEQEVDHALVTGYDLQSGGTVFGFEDFVTLRFQILAGETAEIVFIFD